MDNQPVVGSKKLRVAAFLALTGGFLDAYTFITRGGVFANAQTGNIVMLGIAVIGGKGYDNTKYILSILAFFLGILCVLLIEKAMLDRHIKFVHRATILIEMAAVTVVSFLPQTEYYNLLSNVLISFIAAMQMEGFKSFRGEPIATTMSTGNLRKYTENIFMWITKKDAKYIKTANSYLLVIVTFVAGAMLGGVCSMRWAERAVLVSNICLACAYIAITIAITQSEKSEQSKN
ncbi:MAG: DUF1275 domain-containing protein [Lachnospiraceae bacterium]|nr:DUF1275 domain-containing protein [Lachnospiraceae bacterium]